MGKGTVSNINTCAVGGLKVLSSGLSVIALHNIGGCKKGAASKQNTITLGVELTV